jgi:hypothetical protein
MSYSVSPYCSTVLFDLIEFGILALLTVLYIVPASIVLKRYR